MTASWRSFWPDDDALPLPFFARAMMHNQRTSHLWRLGLTLLIGTFFALGSFWLVQMMNAGGLDMHIDNHGNEPDYIVERFSVVRMTKTGRPSYILSGTKLTHRPRDDSSEVELPFVRSLSAQQPPMDMHAERAHIDQDNSRVHLAGNVKIDRPAGPTVQKMTVRTPALTVFPDLDRIETDQPVDMTLGSSVLTGIGMVVNNATRQIDIAHRLHIIIYPPAPPLGASVKSGAKDE